MSSLAIPVTFVNGGLIQASDHNSNMSAIATWANGNITDSNFGTLTGGLIWSISTNVQAVAVSSSASNGQISLSQTGVLDASQAVFSLLDSAAQVTGLASWYLNSSNSSSTIPAKKLVNAGTGNAELTQQSGVLAVGKDAHTVSVSGAQITGRSASYKELTSASSTIPLEKGLHSGTGDLLDYAGSAGRAFNVDNSGRPISAALFSLQNYIINGAFDFFQRGSAVTVANGVSGYGPDRWYCTNGLGTNGVITLTNAPVPIGLGSLHACEVKITTAPTASQANKTELWYVVPNEDAISLYNQVASFNCSVLAVGNVTQVGVQFFAKASEAKVSSSDTAIGSEVLVAVNSSAYAPVQISGQALGTAMGSSGVIAVRIRITAVSTGNAYALNNGFRLTLASLTLGSYPAGFRRYANSYASELATCQRFYEKSVAVGTAPNDTGDSGRAYYSTGSSAATNKAATVYFRATKRVAPAVTTYDLVGASGVVTTVSASNVAVNGVAPDAVTAGCNSFFVQFVSSLPAGAIFHWSVDSDI